MFSDETLWKGLQAGDRTMFLELYRKYYHCLLFIGLKREMDIHLVKDVIQQQFLYLWEKKETIEEAKNVRSYLISSFVRRLIKDWVRSGKTADLEIAWCNLPEEVITTPEEKLIAKYDREHLNKTLINHIHSLPARQKELLMMKFYEGLNYESIVQQTGLTHRTVYNKIHEAINTLRKKFQKEGESYSMVNSLLIALFLIPLSS
jgi:RNA polymerase sigma-70 factor (ECF subfamily)